MPTYFKFNKKCIDSVVVILKIYLQFKRTVHRISLSITRNTFLLLLVYQRVTDDLRYWKSNTKIKIVPKTEKQNLFCCYIINDCNMNVSCFMRKVLLFLGFSMYTKTVRNTSHMSWFCCERLTALTQIS